MNLLERYFAKSGDTPEVLKLSMAAGDVIQNEHGFAVVQLTEDALLIHACCGDGKYWQEQFEMLAEKGGVKKLAMITRRNPEAWERRFGYKVKKFYMEKEL